MNQLEIEAKGINRPVNTGLVKITCLFTLINLVIAVILIFSIRSTNNNVNTLQGTLNNNFQYLLGNDTADLAANISSLNATFNALQASVSTLTDEYASLSSSITDLQTTTSDTTTSLNQLTDTVNTNTQDISQAQTALTNLSSSYNTVVGGLQTSVNTLNGYNIPTLSATVTTQGTTLTTNTGNIGNITSWLGVLNGAFYADQTTTTSSLNTLNTDVTNLQGNFDIVNNIKTLTATSQTSASVDNNWGIISESSTTYTQNQVFACQVSVASTVSMGTIPFAYTFTTTVGTSTYTVDVQAANDMVVSAFIFVPVTSSTTSWDVTLSVSTALGTPTTVSSSYLCVALL